jgi:hypothetical protein
VRVSAFASCAASRYGNLELRGADDQLCASNALALLRTVLVQARPIRVGHSAQFCPRTVHRFQSHSLLQAKFSTESESAKRTALHSAALLSCASLCVVSALRLECIGRRDRRLQHARSRAKHQRTHRRRKQGRELTIPHTWEPILVAHWWH